MRFEGIEFPHSIIEAQEQGELAIFAGAGVSMPAPSNLPNFNDLANQLANGTATLQQGEAFDRFLGKLPESLNIHERTRTLLLSPDSKPNPLHHDLLRVFLRPFDVRLVTTNFDDHFGTAATEVFPDELPELFFAPALPVGGDFRGIVHLHGNVRQDPRRMILTDRDFGRAYLTEGWARRFVLELFLKYTVLFVGYSHNDPVMQYLARGLPPGDTSKRRYAFGLADSRASWDNLGIQLLPYFERNEENRHVQLQIACTRWAQRVRATPLETREQIRRIVEKPPQPAGEDIDLIEKALGNSVLLQFFTEFATSPEWLHWVSGREAFKRILKEGSSSTDCDQQIARWFAQKFAVQHPGETLDLIRNNGSYIPPLLWTQIAWAVWQSMRTDWRSTGLHKWVPVLIANQPLRAHDFLEYMLAACRLPEDETPALLLLQHLLRPTMILKESIGQKVIDPGGEPGVSVELKARGNSTFVSQGWQHFKAAGLAPYADRLITMAAFHLEEATALYRVYEKEFSGWDPISTNLSKLDTPSISLSHNGLSILVDVARESLKWMIQNQPERGPGLIQGWSSAQSLTLRRLAVYASVLTDRWTADDKLVWLEESQYLFSPGFSAEVRQVLDAAFPSASQQHRDAIVKRVIEGPRTNVYDERVRDGNVLALLVRLDQLVPGDPVTMDAIQEIKKRRPEFAPPALTKDGRPVTFLSPWERLPFDRTSLLARPATESADELLSFEKQEEYGPDRSDVLRVVRDTIQENRDWGFQLADALCARGNFDSDLWQAIISASSGPESQDYTRILRLLSEHPGIAFGAADETINLLQRGTSQEANGIEAAELPVSLEIGLQAWEALVTRQWPRREAIEWLTVAINDSAGILLQTVLRVLVQMKKQAGETWGGLPPTWRAYFSRLVRGDSWSEAMGRIILASQAHLLFWLDRDWTTSVLLQIFDWSVDPLRAQQAWHGYLVWGKWSDDFLEQFLPRYVATFAHLGEIRKFRHQFCQHMAAIAVFSSIDPIKNGWLTKFISTAQQEDRYNWTASVPEMLKQVPEEQRKTVWERWLKAYWTGRLQGIPLLLSGVETAALTEWPLQLPHVFAEAVQLLVKSPPPVSGDEYEVTFLLMQLQESSTGKEQPNELAVLILYLLQAATKLAAADSVSALVQRLIPTTAERHVLVAICERLATLGFSADAADLKRRILGPNEQTS